MDEILYFITLKNGEKLLCKDYKYEYDLDETYTLVILLPESYIRQVHSDDIESITEYRKGWEQKYTGE